MLVKLTSLTGNFVYVNVNEIILVEEGEGVDGNKFTFVSIRDITYKLTVKETADEIHYKILNQLRSVNGVE